MSDALMRSQENTGQAKDATAKLSQVIQVGWTIAVIEMNTDPEHRITSPRLP